MRNKYALFFLIFFAFVLPNTSFGQCTSGCNSSFSATSAANITVPVGQTYCITAPSGNITFSGTITVNGTLCINATNGDISFTGSIYLSPNATINVYSTGSYKVTMDGYFDTFTNPATTARYFNNYGNLNINYNNCGTPCGWRLYKSTKVTNYPSGNITILHDIDMGSNANIDNRGTMSVGGYVQANGGTYIKSSGTFSVTGDMNMTGDSLITSGTMTIGGKLTSGFSSIYKNSGNLTVTGAMTWNGDAMTNSGPLKIGGDLVTAGLPLINTSTMTIGGSWSMNTSLVLTNSGPINVAGNLSFYGNYTQSSTVTVGGLLTFNANSVGEIAGGLFISKDLTFNNAKVNGGATCAAFIASGTTTVNNSGMRATGSVNLLDSTGLALDNTVCPATPANCGLTLGAAGVNSCLSSMGTLPITLLSLKATYISDIHVKIDWKVISEELGKEFILERTEDLKTFQQVGKVESSTILHQVVPYEYIDYNSSQSNDVYYRLNQKSADGSLNVLGFVAPIKSEKSNQIVSTPNPSNGNFKLSFLSEEKVNSLAVTNQTGKVIYSFDNSSDLMLLNKDIELNSPRGIYIVEISTDKGIYYSKISVQ